MSVATSKMKRFSVEFKGHRIFVNAGNKGGAFALARTRFMKVAREAGIEMWPELASVETFSGSAVATEDTRY